MKEFRTIGFAERHYFDHWAKPFDKQYDDSLLHFRWRGFPRRDILIENFRQLNLYATDVTDLPESLLKDKVINWHSQGLGRTGLVAAAGFYITRNRDLFVGTMQSDLVQQIRRAPAFRGYRTRVDKRFGSWHRILFNALLDFALDNDIVNVYCPTSISITTQTPNSIQPGLFQTIYDFPERFYESQRNRLFHCEYWRIAVQENKKRVARLAPFPIPALSPAGKPLICICHDIEEDVDTPIPVELCRHNLRHMLQIEKDAGINATYNILGRLFADKQPIISKEGDHAIAFHSWNHRVGDLTQLKKVRELDLQLKGYRPPQSRLTPELSDYALAFYNFEWLLSSERSLKRLTFGVEHGIVKIPVHLDDYPLYQGDVSIDAWCDSMIRFAEHNTFAAFGFHDCYAQCWSPVYEALIKRLQRIGFLLTCDQIREIAFMDHSSHPHGSSGVGELRAV